MTPNYYENYGHDYSGDITGARRAFDLMYQQGYNPAISDFDIPTTANIEYLKRSIPALGNLTPEQILEIREYGIIWANENAAYVESKKREAESNEKFNKDLSAWQEEERIRDEELAHREYLDSLENYDLDSLFEALGKCRDNDEYIYINDLIDQKTEELEKLALLKKEQELAKRKHRAIGYLYIHKVDFESLDEDAQDFFIAYCNNEIKLSDEFIFVLRRTFNKKLLEFVNPIDLYSFYLEYKDREDEIKKKADIIREADYYFNFSNDIYADERTIGNPFKLFKYQGKDLKDFYDDCNDEVEAVTYDVYKGNLSNIDFNSYNHEKAKEVPWFVYLLITLALSFIIMFEKISYFALLAGLAIFGVEFLLMKFIPNKIKICNLANREIYNSSVKRPNRVFVHRAYAYISTHDSLSLIKKMIENSNAAYHKAYDDINREMDSYKEMVPKVREKFNKEMKNVIRKRNTRNLCITLFVTLIISFLVYLL